MHMFNDGYYMGGMHGGWWLFWLLALLAVGATVLLVRQRTGGSTGVSRESPHEVLRHRLASGGITPAQYEEHKALLDRDGPPPG